MRAKQFIREFKNWVNEAENNIKIDPLVVTVKDKPKVEPKVDMSTAGQAGTDDFTKSGPDTTPEKPVVSTTPTDASTAAVAGTVAGTANKYKDKIISKIKDTTNSWKDTANSWKQNPKGQAAKVVGGEILGKDTVTDYKAATTVKGKLGAAAMALSPFHNPLAKRLIGGWQASEYGQEAWDQYRKGNYPGATGSAAIGAAGAVGALVPKALWPALGTGYAVDQATKAYQEFQKFNETGDSDSLIKMGRHAASVFGYGSKKWYGFLLTVGAVDPDYDPQRRAIWNKTKEVWGDVVRDVSKVTGNNVPIPESIEFAIFLAEFESNTLDEVAGPKDCWDGYKKDGTQAGTGKNKGKRVNKCVPQKSVSEGEPPDYSSGKSAEKKVVSPRAVAKVILDPKGTAREVGGRVIQRGTNAIKCAITGDPTACNLSKPNN